MQLQNLVKVPRTRFFLMVISRWVSSLRPMNKFWFRFWFRFWFGETGSRMYRSKESIHL